MSAHHASSPGKLFLFGEYAVLAGGVAVVAAVDRRVTARRRADADGYRIAGSTGAAMSDALPRAAARAAGCDEAVIDAITCDISALYERGRKLGLGSSAASTAALLRLVLPDASAQRLFEVGFTAHRDIQDGRGSGADVAASCFGGLLGYKLRASQPPFTALDAPTTWDASHTLVEAAQADIVTNVSWPSSLRAVPVWIGEPASSTHLIGRVEESVGRAPRAIMDIFGRLDASARRALEAMHQGDAGEVLAQVAESGEAMAALGEVSEAPIITEAHQSLVAIAQRYGAEAKPSGAGGGDFSWVIGPREQVHWEELWDGLPRGCVAMPMELGAAGARIDE